MSNAIRVITYNDSPIENATEAYLGPFVSHLVSCIRSFVLGIFSFVLCDMIILTYFFCLLVHDEVNNKAENYWHFSESVVTSLVFFFIWTNIL